MGVETRMEDIPRKKGMKTKKQLEKERLEKINEKNSRTEKKPSLNYLHTLQHKKIVLVFMDGEICEGILKSFNKFQICLEMAEIPEFIVFKHAIKYLYEISKEVNLKND
jgi:sRNA-binding regulator protein Hfq